MKKIVLFDTASGSKNSGDNIIVNSINKEMNTLFNNAICISFSTHTCIGKYYQTITKSEIYKVCNGADFKFLMGTNLFSADLLRPNRNWDITLNSIPYYKDAISIGCGSGQKQKANFYTRLIYRKILSKEFTHSTRDERTCQFLRSLGFKAINTGCPTLWGITEERCKQIEKSKASEVIFTLTDYCRDTEADKLLISILRSNYKKLHFWVQGYYDLEYLQSLTYDYSDIDIIPHSIRSYDSFLKENIVDYVGTRLHAGILAMQHGRRSIIVSVDYRVEDMKVSYNLPSVRREEIHDELSKMINNDFSTNIGIPIREIETWKSQFK